MYSSISLIFTDSKNWISSFADFLPGLFSSMLERLSFLLHYCME
jgi:hypothetical protein